MWSFNKLRIVIPVILLLLFCILLVSCNSTANKIGYQKSESNFESLNETTKSGTFKMSYSNFDGSEVRALNVKKGQKIKINYDSSVQSGTLVIVVTDPYNHVLLAVPANKKGTYTIIATASGRLSITVTGSNTSGSFKLTWSRKLF